MKRGFAVSVQVAPCTPGDGSDVWLDVRTVQLYLQISLTSIYKLIHQGEIPIMASYLALAISQNLGDNA
jgi:hypothetical protein